MIIKWKFVRKDDGFADEIIAILLMETRIIFEVLNEALIIIMKEAHFVMLVICYSIMCFITHVSVTGLNVSSRLISLFFSLSMLRPLIIAFEFNRMLRL